MPNNGLEQRCHILIVVVKLTHRETVFGARVNDWKIQLVVGRFQFDEQIKHHVQDLMRPGVFPIDLVDHDDRLGIVLKRFPQHKSGLRLRTIVRVHHQQNAVDHLHDPLYFTPEIGMARRVDNIDSVAVPLEGSVLRSNRNAFFPLQIHGVHDALLHLLVGAEGARLAQQLINQGSLAVVDMRDDGDIADLIHE